MVEELDTDVVDQERYVKIIFKKIYTSSGIIQGVPNPWDKL